MIQEMLGMCAGAAPKRRMRWGWGGAVACKEEQAVKYLSMENANQETENKDERGQDANRGEPLALLLEAVQPFLYYRWDMAQRLAEPQARMREEYMKRTGEEKQLSHSLRGVSTDPLITAIMMSYALGLDV
ncbi:hypothetical protein FD755_021619 [Muntiacus reevesi]|uniref:Uncharacterized protein n=1 Tax=Muntiacus reevesi TaxID=9886 RepID=A0A5N3W1U8_MUNRE|nr:hypothetical protein FD755_021619 [Muntiacus reevesi]